MKVYYYVQLNEYLWSSWTTEMYFILYYTPSAVGIWGLKSSMHKYQLPSPDPSFLLLDFDDSIKKVNDTIFHKERSMCVLLTVQCVCLPLKVFFLGEIMQLFLTLSLPKYKPKPSLHWRRIKKRSSQRFFLHLYIHPCICDILGGT